MKTTRTYNLINHYIGVLGETKRALADNIILSDEQLAYLEKESSKIVEIYREETSRDIDDVIDEIKNYLYGVEISDLIEWANEGDIKTFYDDVDDLFYNARDLLENMYYNRVDPSDLYNSEYFDDELGLYDEADVREFLIECMFEEFVREIARHISVPDELEDLAIEYLVLKEQA